MNSFLILSHPGQAQHFNLCNLQLCLLCHCLGAIYLVYPSKRLQSCKKNQKKLMLSPNVFSRVRTGFCKNAAGKMCFHLISQEPEPLPDIFIYISSYKRHDSPPSPQIRTSAENPSMAALKTLLLTHTRSRGEMKVPPFYLSWLLETWVTLPGAEPQRTASCRWLLAGDTRTLLMQLRRPLLLSLQWDRNFNCMVKYGGITQCNSLSCCDARTWRIWRPAYFVS